MEFLAQLGRDHRKYDISPEAYDHMYRALMDEFAAIMGPDWDDDTQQAASQAMLLTTGVMRGAAQMAEDRPGGRRRSLEKFQISGTWPWSGWWRRTGRAYKSRQYRKYRSRNGPRHGRNLSPRSRPTSTARSSSMCAVRRLFNTSVVKETAVGDQWTFAQAHGTLHRTRTSGAHGGGAGRSGPLCAHRCWIWRAGSTRYRHTFYAGARYPGELYDLAVRG